MPEFTYNKSKVEYPIGVENIDIEKKLELLNDMSNSNAVVLDTKINELKDSVQKDKKDVKFMMGSTILALILVAIICILTTLYIYSETNVSIESHNVTLEALKEENDKLREELSELKEELAEQKEQIHDTTKLMEDINGKTIEFNESALRDLGLID